MKRLIKYWTQYENDAKTGNFSECSTKYEILPLVVDDTAGSKELRQAAKKFGINIKGNVKSTKPKEGYQRNDSKITHFIKTNEVKVHDSFREKEKLVVYLGFITIRAISLPVKTKPNSKLTNEQAYELVNANEAGIEDVSVIGDETFVIMSGWDYYHVLPLNGYSLDHFQKLYKATDRTFHDEVDRCSNCGETNWRDDGYVSNFRYVESAGTLGLQCGCFEENAKKNIEEYSNNAKEAIELSIAEDLQKEGKLKFVERFIGGMTDGRGGRFKGEATREGKPDSILQSLLEENPNKKYVFSHDESGQFQTYFSVWELKKTSK